MAGGKRTKSREWYYQQADGAQRTVLQNLVQNHCEVMCLCELKLGCGVSGGRDYCVVEGDGCRKRWWKNRST